MEYDSLDTTFGNIKDQKTVTLISPMDTGDVSILVESTSGLDLPIYMRVNDEVVWCSSSVDEHELTVVRARLGTTAASHSAGEILFTVIVAEYLNMVRDKLLVAQKTNGKIGLYSELPSSPVVGEVYFATDTKRVYACIVTGLWSLFGGATSHAELISGGETDDHSQYLNATRRDIWHSGLGGEHILGGNNHDHSNGLGIGRIRAGVIASIPGSPTAVEVFYATDIQELRIANSSGVWISVTGATPGTVIMFLEAGLALFGGACPPGWTRVTSLDGRFPKGANSGVVSPLNTGGTELHSHTYTQIPLHSHTIVGQTVTSTSGGEHVHSYPLSTLSGGTGLATTPGNAGGAFASNGSGDHSHPVSISLSNTSAEKKSSDSGAGSSSGTTSTESHMPAFFEVVFCMKS
jgi:microcystin-dependent protein